MERTSNDMGQLMQLIQDHFITDYATSNTSDD